MIGCFRGFWVVCWLMCFSVALNLSSSPFVFFPMLVLWIFLQNFSSFLLHFFSFSHFSSLCLSPFPLVFFVALLGRFYVNVCFNVTMSVFQSLEVKCPMSERGRTMVDDGTVPYTGSVCFCLITSKLATH